MTFRLVVSALLGGVVAGLASLFVPGPFGVGAGTAIGIAGGHVLGEKRLGRAIPWGQALAMGLVAGASAWLTTAWLQR